MFLFSGFLIIGNFVYLYLVAPRLRMEAAGCQTNGAAVCGRAEGVSRSVLWVSTAIYLTGFFASYLLGPILMWLES